MLMREREEEEEERQKDREIEGEREEGSMSVDMCRKPYTLLFLHGCYTFPKLNDGLVD